MVAPEAVTNAKFNEALARTLGGPAVLPVPAFALKVAFGELADALLGGPSVLPARLEQAGFPFQHPDAGAGAGGDAGARRRAGGDGDDGRTD